MIFLTNTNETIQVFLDQSLSTDLTAGWIEHSNAGAVPGSFQTTVAVSGYVELVSTPALDTQRQVKFLTIKNKSASQDQVVHIRKYNSTTYFDLVSVSLAGNQTLMYVDSIGFEIVNNALPLTSEGVIDKTTLAQTVTVVGPTNILGYTVPGGLLGADGLLRLRMSGVWVNGSGGTRNVTISVAYGGTTMWQDASANIGAGTDVGFNFDLVLAANNSDIAQTLTGLIHLGGTGAPTTGATGDLGSDEITSLAVISGSASVDSSVDQAWTVSVQFNNTGTTWTKAFHVIEKL